MSSLLDNAKQKLNNLISKDDIKKDSDVEKWLVHISKLENLKNSISSRIKILSTRYNDLMIDHLDMASEFFTFYSSNENRIDIAQSYLDFNESLKEISNHVWKEQYKNVVENIDDWANIIDKTKSRVLKFQDDLENVTLLADKVKNLKEHLSTVKNPSAQDKNELTASIARLQDLETNMDTYRGQAKNLVKTLIESRFESCDKVMLGLMKLEKLYFEKMSSEVKNNLTPLISNLETAIGEDVPIEHEKEAPQVVFFSSLLFYLFQISKPQARVADPLDSLSDILGAAPTISNHQVSQPGATSDPLNDIFGMTPNNNAPTRNAYYSFNFLIFIYSDHKIVLMIY